MAGGAGHCVAKGCAAMPDGGSLSFVAGGAQRFVVIVLVGFLFVWGWAALVLDLYKAEHKGDSR